MPSPVIIIFHCISHSLFWQQMTEMTSSSTERTSVTWGYESMLHEQLDPFPVPPPYPLLSLSLPPSLPSSLSLPPSLPSSLSLPPSTTFRNLCSSLCMWSTSKISLLSSRISSPGHTHQPGRYEIYSTCTLRWEIIKARILPISQQ